SQQPMSIEAMLDLERKEVLALLESSPKVSTSPEGNRRSASPYSNPRSPVRSMLDIDDGTPSSAAAHRSPSRQPPVRSMLDMSGPTGPYSSKNIGGGSSTTPSTPVGDGPADRSSSPAAHAQHHRSMSDAASRVSDMPRNDPTSGYQFSGILNALGGGYQQQMPLRAVRTSRSQSRGGSLGEALRNSDLGGLQVPGERRGRNSSLGGSAGAGLASRLGNKSKSPHGRISSRSGSPSTFGSAQSPVAGKGYLDDGQTFNISDAYRRLSDANLAFSTGSLSQLPGRKQPNSPGEGRLAKDYLGPDGEYLGSSEEDEAYSTDDENRGRKKEPRRLNPDAKGERKSLSLLAVAEEERKCGWRRYHGKHATRTRVLTSFGGETTTGSQIAKAHQYRSLIPEPEIKVTSSTGETAKLSKVAVHPHTSYDHKPGSATPSAIDSDEEADFREIKRAQNLSFTMTNILSNNEAHRAVRIIYRGEYSKIAQTADEEHRRLRKYLVATDLSEESTHALEWAIGTVLRDGDTLVAIYCVDEETGITAADGGVPNDPKAMKEQATAINTIASSKSASGSLLQFMGGESASNTPRGSPAPSGPRAGAGAGGPEYNKAEEERQRAVRDITDRVLRLLRKTQLQVRVVVEVIHCKSPKHLITEVIDLVSPTLVVIGSRGRSALKGVILGSFSNYLVTKSSSPVMVARKKLRKQSKFKKTAVRQVNNLSNPTARSLTHAKID
ncbi:Universal stress protein family, partial [Geosmithia morbida]